MAKGGPLGFILPAALGGLALASGGAGLPALLGDVGAGVAGAGELGAGLGGTAATIGEVSPELTAGLLAAPATEAGTALSLGSTPLAAGAVDALTAGIPEGLGSIAGTGAGAGAGLLDAGAGLLGPQAGETIDVMGSTLGPPTSLTAGGAGATPVTAQPLGSVEAAGQPLNSALTGFTNTATDFSSGAGAPAAASETGDGGILGTAKDIFGEVGGLKGLTALASAGILGSELLKGPQQYPQEHALGQAAAGQLNLGNQLAQPIQTGALPPGANAAIDLSTAASKARVSSQFAGLGLSGSTMEGQAQNAVEQQAAAQKFGVADKLLQNAERFSSLGTQTTQNLLKSSMEEDLQYRQALANFAKALAGTGAAIG